MTIEPSGHLQSLLENTHDDSMEAATRWGQIDQSPGWEQREDAQEYLAGIDKPVSVDGVAHKHAYFIRERQDVRRGLFDVCHIPI